MHLSQCMNWLVKKLQWVAKNVVVSAGKDRFFFDLLRCYRFRKKAKKLVLPFEGSSSLPQPTLKTDSNKKNFYRATFLATQKYNT